MCTHWYSSISLHERARNVGVLSERNLPEVMHMVHAKYQRNVSYTHWNVMWIVELEDTKENTSVEGCFAVDLGVNVFSTTISD